VGAYDYDLGQESLSPVWLTELFGDDPFSTVVGASSVDPTGSDVLLEHVDKFSDLESLLISGRQVTGARLKKIRKLTRLKRLVLFRTGVTDAALENVKGLAGLKYLEVHRSPHVTPQGIKELQKALPKCEIIWIKPQDQP